MKKTNQILEQVLEKIEPSKEDLKIINESLKDFLKKIKKRIKVLKINAEVFVGGSYAKKTMIKKSNYDIDLFVRFSYEHKDKMQELMGKILKGIKNISVIHGSRDYFQITKSPTFYIEVIPVLKINKPDKAENITDLSYSHVRYVNKKTNKKLLEDIKLAKAFCYANNSYGAESYINGFSGYSLELLIIHFKSFVKFIKAVSKLKNEKTIIDLEKHYKNKQNILMDLNSSKLQSPIILIDPTYKQRNALAALSTETLNRFQKNCRKFLKTPSIKSFEIQKTDLEKIKKNAKKKNFEFILIESKTLKQSGDVAGSKLLKFYKHLSREIEKFFLIKNKGFNYNKEKSARYFFVVKQKNEILISGPSLNDKKNLKAFKKKHKKTYNKKARIYSKEKINFNLKEFIQKFKKKNKKLIKEMYISELRII